MMAWNGSPNRAVVLLCVFWNANIGSFFAVQKNDWFYQIIEVSVLFSKESPISLVRFGVYHKCRRIITRQGNFMYIYRFMRKFWSTSAGIRLWTYYIFVYQLNVTVFFAILYFHTIVYTAGLSIFDTNIVREFRLNTSFSVIRFAIFDSDF